MKYVIYLDEFTEEIFYEMEKISEGLSGHECEIEAENSEKAIDKIEEKLRPFLRQVIQKK